MYSNLDIINSVREHCSQEFKENVPFATSENLNYFYGDDGFYPTYANEFLEVLTNLIIVQRVYEPLSFVNPFDIFYRQSTLLGDTEEILYSDVNGGSNYGDSTDPFQANKPNVGVAYIQTRDKKVWDVTIKMSILRGAFSTEGGLSSLIAQIMGKLRQEKTLYLYDAVKTDLLNIPTGVSITPLTISDTTNAKLFWKNIIKLASDMLYPSRYYNQAHVMANTNKGNFVLVLNSTAKSVLDVEVVASLFNSAEIGANQYFERTITMPLVGTNVIGYIMDRDTYLIVDRINETYSIFNPRTAGMNYFYHNWIKRGLNPCMQAIQLLDNTVYYSSLKFSPNDLLTFSTSETILLENGDGGTRGTDYQIFYSTNGTVPSISDIEWSTNKWAVKSGSSANISEYTTGIAISNTTTIKALCVQLVQNNPKISKVLEVTYTKR